MNKLIVCLITLTLFSCEKICSITAAFCKDKTEKQEPIDFTQIDLFPRFENCNALLNHNESKTCFENTLHKKISERIQYLKLQSEFTIIDTILIHFSIGKEGNFRCKNVKISDSLAATLPNLSVEIQEIVHGLAKVIPAQKRGIPVTSTYTIPLVIKSN